MDTEALRTEGPFGDHTGYYSLADQYPVFHLTCLTHRKNPIYHTTVVGRPPMEDCHMAAAIEALFLPIMKKQLPEIVDFHLPFEGIFHNLALVSIDKQYPGHARKVMHALWGLGRAMVTKRKWPEEGFTRPWPDEIVMDEPTKRLVKGRWKEYGLD